MYGSTCMAYVQLSKTSVNTCTFLAEGKDLECLALHVAGIPYALAKLAICYRILHFGY